MIKVILLIVSSLVFLFVGYFLYWVIRFRNPYKITFVFGKKGSGKSTYLCMMTQKYLKKGWKVYANTEIPGAYLFNTDDLGKVNIPENSLVIVDEASLVWGNRDWKNFDHDIQEYVRKNRHYRHAVLLASQSFDVDRILRDCCDKMMMLVNVGGVLTVAKEIKRKLVVVKPSENAESRITDELVISPWIFWLFGARKLIWIPKWRKYFDSFEKKDLPKKEFQLVQYPDGTKNALKQNRKKRGRKNGCARKSKTYARSYQRRKGR